MVYDRFNYLALLVDKDISVGSVCMEFVHNHEHSLNGPA